MPSSVVLGTGRALPERIVTNDELAALMDTSDEWIRERTGIRERRWVRPGEKGVDFAHQAATAALEMAGLAASDLDAIVYASLTPDHFLPANGTVLQHALGARQIPALNINNGCSGFVYALSVADSYLRVGLARRVLVVGQEIQSTRLDVSTRGRAVSVIFADGAGALVLGASEEPGRGVLGFDLGGDGAYARSLRADGPGAIFNPVFSQERMDAGEYWPHMDGREVFRHAVVKMPASVRSVLERHGLGPGDIKVLIPHQANLRISEGVQKNLGLRDDQVYNNIMRYGNTTSATIPIALDECVREGRLAPGDLLVVTAFGAGFLWGTAAIRW
jgi:3-oxoacyl-[acyl-carrier-protein] synthase-3